MFQQKNNGNVSAKKNGMEQIREDIPIQIWLLLIPAVLLVSWKFAIYMRKLRRKIV